MAHVHLRELTLKQHQESNAGAKLGLVHIVSLNSSSVAFFQRDHLLATKITINTDPTNITIVESRARHRAFLVAEPPSKEEGFHTLLPRKPRRATTPRSRLPKRRGGLKRPSAWVAARDHRDCAVCASSAFRFTPESSIDKFALTHTEQRSRLASVSQSTSPIDQIATWIFVNNATTSSSWRTYTLRTRMRRCARSRRYSLACCPRRR